MKKPDDRLPPRYVRREFDDMTPAEREAWFAERFQVDNDDTIEEQAGQRLAISVAIMIFVVAAVLGLNAVLPFWGYGA